VGSFVNLSSPLLSYLFINYLTKRASIYNSKIYNILLAYGYNNFCLNICEYCDRSNVIKVEKYYIDRSNVIKVEKYYIDRFKLEYNMLTKAGSNLNLKHSK
jgi:group I intron endonuclease